MTPFLKQIAEHYIGTAENISRFAFVFPGNRAMLFFTKYLKEAVAARGGAPLLMPQLMTVDNFFGKLSSSRSADSLTLVLKLYGCYKAICERRGLECESLDDFVFWGEVILNDFGDIDRYMIEAHDILRNVSDLKNLSDDYSYLSERQAAAIEAFVGHFKKEGEYKLRFARLWNILGELYDDFNAALESEGLSYTAHQYRSVAENMANDGAAIFHNAFPRTDKVVFCGLNVLSQSEKKVLGRLRDMHLAEFCWDYSSDWIRNTTNKSSLFMSKNVSEFKPSFELEKCSGNPSIKVIEVPSGIGQTKVVSDLLCEESIPSDERTAIVLPDESLLQPVLNSIPERITKVNVTMGSNMASSSFYSMMSDIAQMQVHLRCKDGEWSFYHRPFWNIVSNPLVEALLDDESRELLKHLKKQKRYYVAKNSLGDSQLLDLIFRGAVTDPAAVDPSQIAAIQSYQQDILNYIGKRLVGDDKLKNSFSLELDFAMEYIKAVNLLSGESLGVKPQTYFALLDNVLRAKSVPLKGEPLSGLQIMGPLETRALDFENVIILSCNEGVFPRSESNTSFIPPLLRAAFELPTYEYHDAVWAYYFYRLLQRASHVTMTLDSRSEGMRSGEESRYIKQLRYHFGAKMDRSIAVAAPSSVSQQDVVYKTPDDIALIKSKEMSPSAMQDYLACPMKFYFSYVQGLRTDDQVNESMDAGIIGSVYHEVMEELYSNRPGKTVTREYIKELRSDKALLMRTVERHAMKLMGVDSIIGRNIVICTIIVKYVTRTLACDLQFMDEENVDSFRIIELEHTYHGTICGLGFKGTVDRVDSFREGMVRLVDYKSGKVLKEDFSITDRNAERVATKIFNPAVSNYERPKIALQFFIYDELLRQSSAIDNATMLSNTVYSTRTIMSKMPDVTYPNASFRAHMLRKMEECIAEILNPEIPFTCHVEGYEDKTCLYCDFKTICGR